MEGEVKDRKKIQFSVPSAVPTQLDPKQAELIRRRRPTPATLFKLTDHASPDEESTSQQLSVSENGALKSKRVNTDIYEPPSLRAVQRLAEAHMQYLDAPQPAEDSIISDSSVTDDIPSTSTQDSCDNIQSKDTSSIIQQETEQSREERQKINRESDE